MGVVKRRRESEPIAFKARVGLKREIDYQRGRRRPDSISPRQSRRRGWRRLCKQIKAELGPVPSSNGRINGRLNELSAEKVQ
jgi:hypothetical protein